MSSILPSLVVLAQSREATGLQRFLHLFPTDVPSIVTLLIAGAAVGLVIWSGTRGGNKQSR